MSLFRFTYCLKVLNTLALGIFSNEHSVDSINGGAFLAVVLIEKKIAVRNVYDYCGNAISTNAN